MKVQSGLLAVLALAVLLTSCRTESNPVENATNVPPELLQRSYLFEIVRYLYRWELDEDEIEKLEQEPQLIVWVLHLNPRLDPGDGSQEADIFLPQLQLTVKVKKENYNIQELKVVDKTPNFRITRITSDEVPPRMPRGCAVVKIDMQELRDYLFRTRDQHTYPDPALVENLRDALRREDSTRGILATNTVTGDQIVYLAPLSPVANDAWVFWEDGHKLLHVKSDIDIANPADWDDEALTVHIFDADEQVVGSHEEAPGSNRFLTRDEVSRAMYNCIILGQRIDVPPTSPSNSTQTNSASGPTN